MRSSCKKNSKSEARNPKQFINFNIKYLILFSISILVFSIFSSAALAFADLSEVGIGARPLALGRAYTAMSSDGSGIFTNPAGLSDFPRPKAITMTGKLIDDVDYIMVGVSNSIRIGTVGIGYISAATSSIPLTTLTSTPTGDVISDPYAFTNFGSSILYLSYSKKMNQVISVGSNLKVLNQGFSLTSGSMTGAAGSGFEADFGIKLRPKNWLSIGGVLKNALPLSSGGKFTWQRNNREEGIPAVLNIGTHIKLFGLGGLRQFRGYNLDLMLEAQTMPKLARSPLWKVGSELWVTKGFALRCGIDQAYKATNSGVTEIDNNVTFGVGLKAGSLNFDYAYHQYGEIQGNISHFFSIGYLGFDESMSRSFRLSPVGRDGLFPFLKKKPKLVTFVDVPETYWAKDSIEYLATLGMMQGYPDKTFKPDLPLSRAQIAVLLVKAKGFKVASGEASKFYDLAQDHWATPYVNVAVKKGYISGYPDGSFKPNQALSHAEGVSILARFAGLIIPDSVSQPPYLDIEKGAWFAPAVYAAKIGGLLEFISEEFKPYQSLTRAEAAEIISKTKFGREKIQELLKK